MAAYRHWPVSLWLDPDNVRHWRILSPDKTAWRLISATLCRQRHCFVADQLWLMICIQEDEGWPSTWFPGIVFQWPGTLSLGTASTIYILLEFMVFLQTGYPIVLLWCDIQQWAQTTRYHRSVMMISNGWRMPSSAEMRWRTESTARDKQPEGGNSNR